MTEKKPELIHWWIENRQYNEKLDVVNRPRIIKVYDNETCSIFQSDSAEDYLEQMNILFNEGGMGEALPKIRKEFKDICNERKAKI